MKVRKGFVSNSSSSSFICDVCGNDYSGMDASLEDAMMYECSNGHTFCEDHLEKFLKTLSFNDIKSLVSSFMNEELKDCKKDRRAELIGMIAIWNDFIPEDPKDYVSETIEFLVENTSKICGDWSDRKVPEVLCPICGGNTNLTDKNVIDYMCFTYDVTKEEILEKFKNEFPSVYKFYSHIGK